ncbi:OmpA family protein [Fulvivirgaceae bacterium BMA12]|uniref:OmpA family protein n=1 Tax=Agaribacillus aureus TaxID=3051825 RepID=A0ABT8LFG7_9BACT|nr:OmpA family protein [Fulvivirgaceae bacterium BMA12]
MKRILLETITRQFQRKITIAPILLFSLFLLSTASLTASDLHKNDSKFLTDTLISLVGKVLDEQTREPVQAQLRFHRLPHGGNVGVSKVKNQEGDYKLTLMKSYQYTITLTAEGYISKKEIVDTHDPDELDNIARDFFMVPTGIGQTLRLKSLIFEQSKTKITPGSYTELNELVEIMKKNPRMVIQLEGHTDYKGPASLNMKLSQSRVEAVKDYLMLKGIKSKKIKLKAFGGSKPISRDTDDEKRSVNRRVEVRILDI